MKHLCPSLLFAFLFLLPFGYAQNMEKTWTFVHKNGLERSFKQGQYVAVKWYDASGKWITKGQLMDITADSLKLSIKDHTAYIAKKGVVEISTRKQSSGRKIAGIFIILAGVILAGLFVLFQVISDSTRQDYQLRAGERAHYWPGAFLGIGIIALGIAYLRSPIPTPDPFGKAWNLQEEPVKSNKIP